MIEEFFDRQQLIDYRMERARETLIDARILLEQGGSLGSIIS